MSTIPALPAELPTAQAATPESSRKPYRGSTFAWLDLEQKTELGTGSETDLGTPAQGS